jgi:cardiolipin synthase
MKNLNLPNRLTIARIIAVPAFIICVSYSSYQTATAIFAFCVITDFLDGLIARMRGERTRLGAFLDPMADKFLLISSFITFAALKKIPVWLPVVVTTKDIIVFLGWWLRFHITGNSEIIPSFFGKIATALEMAVILMVLTGKFDAALEALTYVTLAAIILSTMDYMFSGIREMEKK